MRNLDLFWASKKEWWEIKNHIRVLRDDAPPEAKESYEHYLKQKGIKAP